MFYHASPPLYPPLTAAAPPLAIRVLRICSFNADQNIANQLQYTLEHELKRLQMKISRSSQPLSNSNSSNSHSKKNEKDIVVSESKAEDSLTIQYHQCQAILQLTLQHVSYYYYYYYYLLH